MFCHPWYICILACTSNLKVLSLRRNLPTMLVLSTWSGLVSLVKSYIQVTCCSLSCVEYIRTVGVRRCSANAGINTYILVKCHLGKFSKCWQLHFLFFLFFLKYTGLIILSNRIIFLSSSSHLIQFNSNSIRLWQKLFKIKLKRIFKITSFTKKQIMLYQLTSLLTSKCKANISFMLTSYTNERQTINRNLWREFLS